MHFRWLKVYIQKNKDSFNTSDEVMANLKSKTDDNIKEQYSTDFKARKFLLANQNRCSPLNSPRYERGAALLRQL
jgi:hypothetical protein